MTLCTKLTISYSLFLTFSAAWSKADCATKLAAFPDPLAIHVGQTFDFVHPSAPKKKLRLHFRKTSQTPSDFFISNPNYYYFFVETIPSAANEYPHVVAIVNRVDTISTGSYETGWLISTRHQEVLAAVETLASNHPDFTRYQCLQLLGRLNGENLAERQVSIQSKFIGEQMQFYFNEVRDGGTPRSAIQRLQDKVFVRKPAPISDNDFNDFFNDVDTQMPPPGVAFAILEKFSQLLPLGTDVQFQIAHEPTLGSIAKGVPWKKTPLGRYTGNAGLELESVNIYGAISSVTLTKGSTGRAFFFPITPD